jgi:phosphatidate cytidylyltransferase
MNDTFTRRAVVGTAFVLLVTGLTYVGGVAFLFLILAVVLAGLVEFYALAAARSAVPFRKTGLIAGAAVPLCAFLWGPAGLAGAAAGACGVSFAAALSRRSGGAFRDASVTAVGVLYVAALVSFVLLLREGPARAGLEYEAGFRAAMYAFAATWCNDTFAYLFGRAFGRHKMLPSVSPKKSWEGAAAGLVGSVGGLALADWALGGSMPASGLVALGLAAGAVGQVGDFVESKMKRTAGVKDSSRLIPGHGGVLDRFDGFLFAAPVIYFYLSYTGFAGL